MLCFLFGNVEKDCSQVSFDAIEWANQPALFLGPEFGPVEFSGIPTIGPTQVVEMASKVRESLNYIWVFPTIGVLQNG